MTTDKELPKNRIAELRKNKKLSQSELAKETGLTRQAISLYEIGKREPKLKIWIKLADFFNVSVAYIQGTSDVPDNIGKVGDVLHKREDNSKKNDYISNFLDDQRLREYQLLIGGYRGIKKPNGDIVPNGNKDFYDDYLLEDKITDPHKFVEFMKVFETLYESFLKGYGLSNKDYKEFFRSFFEKMISETDEFESELLKKLHKDNK